MAGVKLHFPKITVCLNHAPYSPECSCVHTELLGFLEVFFHWHEQLQFHVKYLGSRLYYGMLAFCSGEKKIRAHLSSVLQVLDGEMDSNYNIQVEPHAMIVIPLTCTNNVTSNLYAAITIENKVLFIP